MKTRQKLDCFFFIAIVIIPLFYGLGQEVFALYLPHDDYYFILRALSFEMKGSYFGPIKEVLYPLFIKGSSLLGLNLRNFEVFCYGISLFFLWLQLMKLSKNYFVSFVSIIPLMLFSYQHPVFNRTIYDVLTLILVPLSFVTSISIYLKKASWLSLIWGGVVVFLHVVTRPEGFLFIFPPLFSLVIVFANSNMRFNKLDKIKHFFVKAGVLFLFFVLSQQVASAINWQYFGFWAPTIVKEESFQRCLKSLMAIDPEKSQKIRFAPVSKESLEKAYQVSPTLRKVKSCFTQNMDGNGWSSIRVPGYYALDGSISGGLFQWALLDAGAFASQNSIDNMLKYFDTVADEIEAGFKNEKLIRRRVYSTALGPNFSFFEKHFWSSVWKIGGFFLNLSKPNLPTISHDTVNSTVKSNFDKVALRRTGLLEPPRWYLEGWVISSEKGLPKDITLDNQAVNAGAEIHLTERPDVARIKLGLDRNEAPHPLCGIEIRSEGTLTGSLKVVFQDRTNIIPLKKLRFLISGESLLEHGIIIHADKVRMYPRALAHTFIPVTTWITKTVHATMKFFIFVAIVILFFILPFRKTWFFRSIDFSPAFFISGLAVSIALPRLMLLAAVDANMHPGTEARYLAPGVFSVWLLAAFVVLYSGVGMVKNWRKS